MPDMVIEERFHMITELRKLGNGELEIGDWDETGN
jgi:hypothetical protein